LLGATSQASLAVGREAHSAVLELKPRDDVGLATQPTGADHESTSFTSNGRYEMTAMVQFIVLKREDKWVVKSQDLERVFSVQREAFNAAVRLANDSGKEGKPGVVLFQKSKAEFQKIWIYGESLYPPARSDFPPMPGTPKRRKLADTPA
jgi:hypothetical protein